MGEGVEFLEEERRFLNLGLKFRMMSGVDLHKPEVEVEKWCVKTRWTLKAVEDKEDLTEEQLKNQEAGSKEDKSNFFANMYESVLSRS